MISFVEDGKRCLSCKNKEYSIERGSVILFNPGDNHACAQSDGRTFDYRGFNISSSIMLDLAEEVTGKRGLPDCQVEVKMSRCKAFLLDTLFSLW